MKKMQKTILDLHYDILKEIVIRVARSSDGARDFAKAISICKAFRRFVEDGDVLRAVAFDNLLLSGRWQSFQLIEGLVNRCAQAGHSEAQFILGKIILVSSSNLLSMKREATDQEAASDNNSLAQTRNDSLQNAQVLSFMENFLPTQIHCHTTGFHFYVKLFLSRARFGELEEMCSYVKDYMEYFMGGRGFGGQVFNTAFNQLCRGTTMELFEQNITELTNELCSDICKCMQRLGMEKQLVHVMEVRAEEGRAARLTLVERVDVSIKRFRAIKSITEEGFGRALSCLPEQTISKGFPELVGLSEKMTLMDNIATAFRHVVSSLEDLRAAALLTIFEV